ncbi:MAG: NADH-quinone oxidoreductase subunit N, partial [Alphaproteobacteria bacterium]|nr:NADH-quinone oxidoreductase subunit N [Alphaproteobacteria bacterium]
MGIFETLSTPELLLVIGAMVLLIAGVTIGDKIAKQISRAAIVLLVGAMLLVLFGAGAPTASLFDGAFRIDAFSDFAKIIIFGAAAFAILMSERYLAGLKSGRFEYSVLILLAAFGMALMVSATDLISLYMGI